MRIYGIDFTSRPTPRKPITCMECTLADGHLRVGGLREWRRFEEFEAGLRRPGAWIAGMDFPFGQSRRFIDNIGWPDNWAGYVAHVATMQRSEFRAALDDYRRDRPAGDKEHRRACDIACGAISPQKLYGVPVGLMFYEGAPRLLDAGVTIPGVHPGDPQRVAVEAYPGVLARYLIGKRSYKQDTRAKQTTEQHRARGDILRRLDSDALRQRYGLTIDASPALLELADDPSGDRIDALLCCVQAAWAWMQRARGFGVPDTLDALEGWIADPEGRHAVG